MLHRQLDVSVKLTVQSAGRWLSRPGTVRPARPFSEAHQVEARFATVRGSVPKEPSDERHGSQFRTRQLLAFPLCKHNAVLQHKKHTHTHTSKNTAWTTNRTERRIMWKDKRLEFYYASTTLGRACLDTPPPLIRCFVCTGRGKEFHNIAYS